MLGVMASTLSEFLPPLGCAPWTGLLQIMAQQWYSSFMSKIKTSGLIVLLVELGIHKEGSSKLRKVAGERGYDD